MPIYARTLTLLELAYAQHIHFNREGHDMLPLHDLNPTRRTPFFTYGLIAINVLVFLWEQTFSAEGLQRVFMDLSVVPANISQHPFSLESNLDIVRSMFFHGDWLHIGGNMLYLYLFGDNIEDRFGGLLYLFLYLACGFVAVYAQVFTSPNSTIPLVGASGAIAGVLGSYLILFPGVRVRGIIPIGYFARYAEWPAWIVLALWFVLQLFNSLLSLGVTTGEEGGVAFFAHIGGFIVGMVITWLFMRVFPQPEAANRNQMLYERSRRYRY
jgi:membrane associated rhomboid family serine protease